MNFSEFEILTGRLFLKRLKKDLKCKIQMDHQRSFTSFSGNKYNVDIAFSFQLMGIDYLTVVECKYWNTRVSREKVGYLKAVIDDLKASKGIIVSKDGFQKGAIKYAKSQNITLIQVTNEHGLVVILCLFVNKKEFEELAMFICIKSEKKVSENFNFLNGSFKPTIFLN